MAMVRHRCLVSLVAICMADEPLLITPLMQHGSLNDFMASVHHIKVSTAPPTPPPNPASVSTNKSSRGLYSHFCW